MSGLEGDYDVFGHVQAVKRKIGGPDISELSRDLYLLAGHSRSALFAAKALAEGGKGVGEHVLNLIELAHGALVGRFEEIEEGVEMYGARLNKQITELVREQLALRKTVEALVSMLDSSDLETAGEAANLLFDDWVRLKEPGMEHVFWRAFTDKLQDRGISIGFEESPEAPGTARPVVFTEASAKGAKKRARLQEQFVRNLVALDVASLDDAADKAPLARKGKAAKTARSAATVAG